MPKIIPKLSETQIKNAKPKAKAYKLCDDGGLRLLVRPTGKKVWQYPYKYADKHNTFTIGDYELVGTAEARKKVLEIKRQLKDGIDPNQSQKDQRRRVVSENMHTFEKIAREWYEKQEWADKHAKNINSRLEKDVFPIIGKKPIMDVSIRDVLDILRKIEERGAYDVAKRINQYCTSIFDYAILMDICENNPALGRGKFVKSVKRQNRPHLTEDEVPAFMKKLEGYNGKRSMKLLVKLLALTFVRPGEIRGARWDEIDFEKALWSVPAERMKMKRDHLVPLSNQAMLIIYELKEISGHTELLFPSSVRNKFPISDVAVIKAVKYFTDNKAVPHGFRHTASTILNENGFNGDHIEAQLAHVEESKVRGTYNKAQYMEPRRTMMQWWADYLQSKAK